MQAVTTIGLDIAKSVFQIHGVDAAGNVIVRRQLKRRYVLPFFQRLPPCLIGIEACASSHHWSRELKALGHTVRLMPAAYVKPYVKRQKNDAADAEAICEAVTRANMRFVATKTLEQQSCLMLHRTRHLFIRQQTAVINAIRAHLAEFGIVAPVGRNGVEDLLNIVADCGDKRLPDVARACVAALGAQLRMLKARILEFDRLIVAWHRSNEASKRLDDIPGVGPALATALVASVADPKAFRSGRDFSAWIGLVPKQHSSGGKDKLGKPDVLLAPTTLTALALRTTTDSIPIVCPLLENPVGLGLVARENRPDKNVTGLLRYVDGLSGKHVELARELIPTIARIGLLANVTSADPAPRRDVETAASKLSIRIVSVEVEVPSDLDIAFTRLAREQVEAVIILHNPLFFSERRRIVTLAAASRLPTIWTAREFVEDGGVLSYGSDEADAFRRAAAYVAKILKGAKAGDLPIELPTKFELLINLKTARALGLAVPATLLTRADEVIE
jgi:transposase